MVEKMLAYEMEQATQAQLAMHQNQQMTQERPVICGELLGSAVAAMPLDQIIPSRLRKTGQPMTRSGQVCKQFLTGTCTHGLQCSLNFDLRLIVIRIT